MRALVPILYIRAAWICFAWGFLGAVRLLAQSSPSLLPLQFRVADSNGVAVADGVRTVTFRMYTNAVAGAASWVETHRDVGVRAGVAGVMLGSINGTITNLDFAEVQYLGIAVEPASGSGVAVEMVPRTVLLPTIRATVVERARSFPGGVIGTVELARATVPVAAMAPGTALGNLQGLPGDRLVSGAMAQNIFSKGYFGDGTVLVADSRTNVVLRTAGYVAVAEVPSTGIFLYEKRVVPPGFSLIPAGPFKMGVTSGDTDANAPSIDVTVSAFLMQTNEVTKAQWDGVRTWGLTNGYTDLEVGEGKATNHPVQTVSWFDVIKWCNARSAREGLKPVYTVGGVVMKTGTEAPDADWTANGYRLPTEAEWEKAARGGVTGKRFPWGDTISHTEANFNNAGTEAYRVGAAGLHPGYTNAPAPYTSPVGSFPVNGYGLADMSGNVYEWCWDWYGDAYYTQSRGSSDPRGASNGADRVLRGGSWGNGAIHGRCAFRLWDAPGVVYDDRGFRPARGLL